MYASIDLSKSLKGFISILVRISRSPRYKSSRRYSLFLGKTEIEGKLRVQGVPNVIICEHDRENCKGRSVFCSWIRPLFSSNQRNKAQSPSLNLHYGTRKYSNNPKLIPIASLLQHQGHGIQQPGQNCNLLDKMCMFSLGKEQNESGIQLPDKKTTYQLPKTTNCSREVAEETLHHLIE